MCTENFFLAAVHWQMLMTQACSLHDDVSCQIDPLKKNFKLENLEKKQAKDITGTF